MEKPSVEHLIKKSKIFQVTNPRLAQTGPQTSIKDAIAFMQKHGSGYLVIAENNAVLGIFTATDIAVRVISTGMDQSKPVSDVMTKDPVVLKHEDTVERAMELMAKHNFDHIPLVHKDTGELAGVLSVRSLIRFLAEFYPSQVLNLPPDYDQVMTSPEGG